MNDPRQEYDLSGRVAIVTGAGSGIGRASAAYLAAVGAAVVCADVNADAAKATAEQITGDGGTATAQQVDVSRRDDVAQLVSSAVTDFGQLDVMCNIAGIMRNTTVIETPEETLDEVLGVNLKGVFFGCQEAARVMVEQGSGSIVNMSSGAIDTPAPGLVTYAVAKAGVAQLTKSLATEVAPSGVRVNAIAPGFIITNMTARHYTNPDGTVDPEKEQQVKKGFASMAPLRRVGQPEDIASAVLFLASDASSYMTGQILRPNGGVSMP